MSAFPLGHLTADRRAQPVEREQRLIHGAVLPTVGLASLLVALTPHREFPRPVPTAESASVLEFPTADQPMRLVGRGQRPTPCVGPQVAGLAWRLAVLTLHRECHQLVLIAGSAYRPESATADQPIQLADSGRLPLTFSVLQVADPAFGPVIPTLHHEYPQPVRVAGSVAGPGSPTVDPASPLAGHGLHRIPCVVLPVPDQPSRFGHLTAEFASQLVAGDQYQLPSCPLHVRSRLHESRQYCAAAPLAHPSPQVALAHRTLRSRPVVPEVDSTDAHNPLAPVLPGLPPQPDSCSLGLRDHQGTTRHRTHRELLHRPQWSPGPLLGQLSHRQALQSHLAQPPRLLQQTVP